MNVFRLEQIARVEFDDLVDNVVSIRKELFAGKSVDNIVQEAKQFNRKK